MTNQEEQLIVELIVNGGDARKAVYEVYASPGSNTGHYKERFASIIEAVRAVYVTGPLNAVAQRNVAIWDRAIQLLQSDENEKVQMGISLIEKILPSQKILEKSISSLDHELPDGTVIAQRRYAPGTPGLVTEDTLLSVNVDKYKNGLVPS